MDDGFTRRAIRAATRGPRVEQPPSPVPIRVAVAADLRADATYPLEAGRATSAVAFAAPTVAPA